MARRGENIYKRGDGRWEGRYIRGRTPEGRAQYGYVYAATYSACREKRRQRLRELPREITPSNNMTLPEAVELFFVEREQKRKLKESTVSRYRYVVQQYIQPQLGAAPLYALTEQRVADFYRKLQGHGLSAKSTRDVGVLLRAILRMAAKRGCFCTGVNAELPVCKKRQVEIFTEPEILRLAHHIVEDYVKQAGSVRLHHAKSTENSRTILGLTAAGYNAANVAGVDLTAGLTDMAYLRAQGTNGPIWALIALDCHGYDIPQCADGEEQTTREGLVAEILSYQCSDGGWALMGDESDVDMTAMALTSLAPYQEETDVKAAVDAALTYLSGVQQADGGFMSWGESNSESCAQVIVALTALGIDPASDERFLKDGASPLDGLCAFACTGGGFRHSVRQTEPDGMATEQGFYALTAYDRFRQGKTRLFDMTDIA